MPSLGSLPAPVPLAASFPILLFWFGLALGVGCRPLAAVHSHGSRGGHVDDGGSPSYVAAIYLVCESPPTALLVLFGFSAATITIFGCLHGRNRRSTTSTNRTTSGTTDIERPHGTCGHEGGQTQLEEVRSLSTDTAGYIRDIKVDNEPQSPELLGPEVAALADLPSKPIQPLNIISAMRVPHEYINDLKIHGLIGLGACGRTYVARWKNQSVAVKIMDHFVRATNATALGKMPVLATVVDHPNVLPIHRIAVIEMPQPLGGEDPLLLPKKERHYEFERAQKGKGGGVDEDESVDLLDDIGESDESWGLEDVVAEDQIAEHEVGSSGTFGPLPGKLVRMWDLVPFAALDSQERLPLAQDQQRNKPDSLKTGLAHSQNLQSLKSDPASSNSPGDRMRALSQPLRYGMCEVWVVLQFADKGALEDHIVNNRLVCDGLGRPKPDMIVRILLDIANGLEALHKHGIVHGDLKMCNVMLVSDQSDLKGFKAKVCDAGLIPLLDLTQTHASTRHHARLTCLPPEFIKKDENSNAMDVYMFSMVMYKLWTRVRPFRGMDLSTFFHKVIEGEERPKIPEDLPQGLAKLMMSCWASDPTQRPSFATIIRILEEELSFLNAKSLPN